jgi:hypothetical protein
VKTKNLIPWLYLSLGVAQTAHSVEEVLAGLWKNFPIVTGFVHARIPFIPVMSWSPEGFATANLVIVGVVLAFSPFVFLKQLWTWKIVRILAVVEVLNGILHSSAAILKGGYFSGCVSAVFLFLLGVVTLVTMGRSRGYQSL